jgi:predicted dehydrogenase
MSAGKRCQRKESYWSRRDTSSALIQPIPAAASYINEPKFIEIHRLAEFNPRGNDVSVILDLMIHDIDILLQMVKSKITSIDANGAAVVSSSPDIASARIAFENGCVANLTASRISLKNMRRTRLFQKGRLYHH